MTQMVPNYRLSVSGSAVTKIEGLEAPNDRYAIAEAHNRLKSGDFTFLEHAQLERREGSNLTPIARFEYVSRNWEAYRP